MPDTGPRTAVAFTEEDPTISKPYNTEKSAMEQAPAILQGVKERHGRGNWHEEGQKANLGDSQGEETFGWRIGVRLESRGREGELQQRSNGPLLHKGNNPQRPVSPLAARFSFAVRFVFLSLLCYCAASLWEWVLPLGHRLSEFGRAGLGWARKSTFDTPLLIF